MACRVTSMVGQAFLPVPPNGEATPHQPLPRTLPLPFTEPPMPQRARLIPILVSLAVPLCLGAAAAPATQPVARHNNPERVAWFGDLSLGMFIHWSVDAQLGVVISHSLVGASE